MLADRLRAVRRGARAVVVRLPVRGVVTARVQARDLKRGDQLGPFGAPFEKVKTVTPVPGDQIAVTYDDGTFDVLPADAEVDVHDRAGWHDDRP